MPFGVCAVYRWMFEDIMAMRDPRCCVGGSWAMDHRSQVSCVALDLDLSLQSYPVQVHVSRSHDWKYKW
jgi:hypothetical protein